MSTVKTRDVVLAVIVAAGFLLFQYAAEEVDLLHGAGGILAILGLIVALGAVATFAYDKLVTHPVEVGAREVPQPAVSRFLFHDTRSAPLWLVVRFYLGFQWLEAGYHKLTGTGWMDGGAALKGYWTKAVALDPKTGTGPISNDYGWYRDFLQFLLNNNAHVWFAKVIVFGELLVGIGIIVGGLVGIAAFCGALMNMSFMLAGSASTNPVLFGLAVLLMLGWQVAGYYGADRFILPLIGAPWKPGKVFHRGAPIRATNPA
jgi:thiosulfate dehydrogenase [quinone] large subunit